MNTIQSAWEKLSEKVFIGTTSETQHQEMEKAFYCGAMAIISIMLSIRAHGLSDDACIKIFTGLTDECIDFFENKLMEGRGKDATETTARS